MTCTLACLRSDQYLDEVFIEKSALSKDGGRLYCLGGLAGWGQGGDYDWNQKLVVADRNSAEFTDEYSGFEWSEEDESDCV